MLTLSKDDAHKIVNVLRLRSGDTIVVVDSAAQEFRATLAIEDGNAGARLDELIVANNRESSRQITLAQMVPKGQKLDYVVEKATELGLFGLIPVYSSRSIGEASANKLTRWRNLARSAAQQSGRTRIPDVEGPIDFVALVARIREYDAALFAWELASQPLRKTLVSLERARSILVIVGPEGGFSHEEADAAIAAGAHAVSLGSRILRTETAPLVLLTAILYEGGEL
jgi:16S rRNA (uracil1498-N3)-methyltransferase